MLGLNICWNYIFRNILIISTRFLYKELCIRQKENVDFCFERFRSEDEHKVRDCTITSFASIGILRLCTNRGNYGHKI